MATAVPPPVQSAPRMARAVRMQAAVPVPKLGGDHGRDPGQRDGGQISQRLHRREGGRTSHKPPRRMLHSISARKYPGSAVGGAVLLTEV